MDLLTTVQNHTTDILDSIYDLRKRLHEHPEIALKEYKTSQVLRDILADSIDLKKPFMETDVVGDISNEAGSTICFRADIDALEMCEDTGLKYASKCDGMMHGCGHDGHTAILAGTALVLSRMKESLPVNVRFAFQPGEEMLCGGKDLVNTGILDDVDHSYALHGKPGLKTGVVSSRVGALFAAGCVFEIEINGKGCHGAMPDDGNNPLDGASYIAEKFRVLHKEVSENGEALVSVCSVQGGNIPTVIPDSAKVLGTARYLKADYGQYIKEQMRRIVDDAVEEFGLEIELRFDSEYDIPVLNSEEGYAFVKETTEKYLGCEYWDETEKPTMGMEDFSYFLDRSPGAMFWLGLGEECPSLHNPKFDFNNEAIRNAIVLFCMMALTHK